MADNENFSGKESAHVTRAESTSGGNAGLAFIVGALVVAVGVLAYVVLYTGDGSGSADDVDITIEGGGSAVEEAADAVEGAADAASDAADGN